MWSLEDRSVLSRLREVIVAVAIQLENASLASQAVGPPVSDCEMSCSNRAYADIGRRLLSRTPRALQAVSAIDSVLAPLRTPFGRGLLVSYSALIERAFEPRYWSGEASVAVVGRSFTQKEAGTRAVRSPRADHSRRRNWQ